jgi:hypothetical protein
MIVRWTCFITRFLLIKFYILVIWSCLIVRSFLRVIPIFRFLEEDPKLKPLISTDTEFLYILFDSFTLRSSVYLGLHHIHYLL